MSDSNMLHLGLLLEATGRHVASWLDPSTQIDAADDLSHYRWVAQLAERAKLDLIFASDSPGIPTDKPALLSRRALFVTRFEPITLLSALAMTTSRIGLGGTVSTSFAEPYNVARYFASLDRISGGRAAWNVVTTASDYSARNFGLDKLPDHPLRYSRASEFLDVVRQLWDTYEDDAFIRDREAGLYFDPAKFHPTEHVGDHFTVRGALNASRTPQGHPVIIQAGSSEAGRDLAARTADVIFSHAVDLDAAHAFYRDIKGRAAAAGRSPDTIKIMPGLRIVLGETRADAEARFARLRALIHPDIIRDTMSVPLEIDLGGHPLDAPITLDMLPERPNRYEFFFAHLRDYIERTRPTLQQIYDYWDGQPFIGTPTELADMMEQWFTARAVDGFMLSFETLADNFQMFVDEVVPELQRRGLFRRDYDGPQLRDHLGIARPADCHQHHRPAGIAAAAGR